MTLKTLTQSQQDTYRLAAPPPTHHEAVQVVTQRYAPARTTTQGSSGYRLSRPPASVRQLVQVVPQNLVQESNEEYRLSTPPAAVRQPVQVVATSRSYATETETAMSPFLSFKEVDYTREIGSTPDSEQTLPVPVTRLLDYQEVYRIIRVVAEMDSGNAGYAAISANREYETIGQPAYQRRAFGLGFGLVLFTQESGHLGSLLKIMQRRDAGLFAEIFGPDVTELLAVTNAATPAERLQPIGGENLWSPRWIERFQQAAAIATFQAAQNEEAIEHLFRPMLNIVFDLGFTTDRALALAFDRVVTRGVGAGVRWILGAAGPLRTATHRQTALHLLGYPSIKDFQAEFEFLPHDGIFGPETHGALVAALREADLIPLPSPDELMRRLLLAAGEPTATRLRTLHQSPAFQDVVYRLE